MHVNYYDREIKQVDLKQLGYYYQLIKMKQL